MQELVAAAYANRINIVVSYHARARSASATRFFQIKKFAHRELAARHSPTMWLDKLKQSLKLKALSTATALHQPALKAFKGGAEPQPWHWVDDFQQVLLQERRTADQTGEEFSLLVFEFGGAASGDDPAQQLWQVIHRRVRRTDKLGWLSKQSLGLILPETPFAGGRKVAEDICRILDIAMPSLSCKILTYPPRHGLV